MPAGYSETPLVKKLGIKPEMKVYLINAPDNYFDLLQQNLSNQLLDKTDPDLVHLFVTSNRQFEQEMKKLKSYYIANPEIVIWVSWYKKSSGLSTDLTEDVIRKYALQNGLVDIKVCAVSDIWSGLKLVVPKSKR